MKYIGIDIGGTWIKGAIVGEQGFSKDKSSKYRDFQTNRIKSSLHSNSTLNDFIKALNELIDSFNVNIEEVMGIGISTAGIVDYHGTKVLKAAPHLNVLKCDSWKTNLEKHFQCSVTIINDADAAVIGLAEYGYLSGNKTIGIMPIGQVLDSRFGKTAGGGGQEKP